MRRIWLVDDRIPIHALYPGPYPTRLDVEMVRHLVEQAPEGSWEEIEVLEICRTLCAQDYEASFFTSPEAMIRALDQGAVAPHAVVFDWQYPGSTNERNLAALDKLLGKAFTYVQIYTHLGAEGVDPLIGELKAKYRNRLLPPKTKAAVTAVQLAQEVRQAWAGTIAGEVADKIRAEVSSAVEQTLVDLCEVGRGTIAALSQGEIDNIIHVILSKIRNEVGMHGAETLNAVATAGYEDKPSEELRRLLSVWYYSFPCDERVRRGDLVEINGELGLVVTPPCDLPSFSKKTGRRLTLLKAVRLDQPGLTALRALGLKLDQFGNSIVAGHGGAPIVLLPSVPLARGDRTALADYAVLCHAWENHTFPQAPTGEITYAHLPNVIRRCTLTEPFASAMVARVASVISSPGTPDLPKGELARLNQLLAAQPPAAVATNPPQQPQP